MGRIDPLPRAALPQYEDLFEGTTEFMGVLPNSLLTMAKKPELFERFMEWSFVVLRPDEIDGGLKQLVAMLPRQRKAAGTARRTRPTTPRRLTSTTRGSRRHTSSRRRRSSARPSEPRCGWPGTRG
jgi:hypothetical protein